MPANVEVPAPSSKSLLLSFLPSYCHRPQPNGPVCQRLEILPTAQTVSPELLSAGPPAPRRVAKKTTSCSIHCSERSGDVIDISIAPQCEQHEAAVNLACSWYRSRSIEHF